jgi:ribonucleoside-triphosphate reductase
MLRIDMDFPSDFNDLYNKFNNTQKGKEYLELSGISRDKLDIATISRQYFENHTSDVSVDPNANVGQLKNLNTFSSETMKGLFKLDGYFLLWKYIEKLFGSEEATQLISSCIDGKFYPHDLTKINVPYCVAVSTFNIMLLGRPYGPLQSKPPKRASSFIAQCIEHLMSMSQEFAGAVAFGDLLINYAWYINRESDGIFQNKNRGDEIEFWHKKIENDFQSFVHVANNNFRIGGDSPFSNISLYCRKTIKNMFENYCYPDGTSPLDIIDTVMAIQKIFMKFISQKDPLSNIPYRFPIVTVNLFVDGETRKVEDNEVLEQLAESNTEGVFNIFITNDKARIASCCRMINNKTDLMSYKGIDSFGNGGLNLGSHRVVTINYVRLARKSKNIEEFKIKLKEAMDEAAKILVAHRQLIKDRIDQNFLQFFKPMKWLDLDTMFFSTIGFNGIYEAFKYLGTDLINSQDMAIDVFQCCNDIINELATKYQLPFNLEQIPGEGAAINLAKKDKVFFGDNEYLLYSNQFIPLWENVDLITRAKIDGKLSKFFGGGVITHLNISSKTSKEQMIKLISFATSCGLDHFALNACFSKCSNGHVSVTSGTSCPICGEQISEKYTRVVGYLTPVNNWVKERRVFEFPLRKFMELKI